MPLFRRKPKDDDVVDPNDRSPQLGIRYKDLQVLGALSDKGADLTKPRHALYYLYLRSREDAEDGAAQARSIGYSCEVREPLPEHPGQWLMLCEREDAVLYPTGVIEADDFFQGIADRLGGEFDGWEAAAQP